MQRSLIPFIFLGLALPSWPIELPEPQKHDPKELPQAALELIPGVGPVLAKKLKEHQPWYEQAGVGPKTKEKLSKVLRY